jgi:hypothetical protein
VAPPIVLATVHADDVCSLHRWRSLLVLSWHATPTVACLPALLRAATSIVRPNPAAIVLCAISGPDTPLPDAEARAGLRASIQKLGELRAVVNVISGTGFRAAALRAMLSGFSMVVRQKYPTGFVGSVAEAGTFLDRCWPEQDAPAPGAAEICRALTSVAPRGAIKA